MVDRMANEVFGGTYAEFYVAFKCQNVVEKGHGNIAINNYWYLWKETASLDCAGAEKIRCWIEREMPSLIGHITVMRHTPFVDDSNSVVVGPISATPSMSGATTIRLLFLKEKLRKLRAKNPHR